MLRWVLLAALVFHHSAGQGHHKSHVRQHISDFNLDDDAVVTYGGFYYGDEFSSGFVDLGEASLGAEERIYFPFTVNIASFHKRSVDLQSTMKQLQVSTNNN